MSYERSDASLRVIGISVALLVGGLVASIVVSAMVYRAKHRGPDAVATTPRETSFMNGPRAEPGVVHDARQVQTDAAGRLDGYGWVDRQTQVVHIPIERAMELAAKGVQPAQGPKDPAQAP